MKYDVKLTSQFKKDLQLAKKQNKNINKLFDVIDLLANGKTLEQNIKIIVYRVIIKVIENATSILIGCLYMKSKMIFWFWF